MVDMVIKHKLGNRTTIGRILQQQKAVGFSCVLFAYITYAALVMNEFCFTPFGQSEYCFETWRVPIFGGGECIDAWVLELRAIDQLTAPKPLLID